MSDAELRFWTTRPNVFLVATSASSGKVLGCISYKQINSSTVEMHRCAVDSNFRGLGIGRKLVQNLLDTAKENGYEMMNLETSSPQLIAIEMYQKMGFTFLRYIYEFEIPFLGFFTGLKVFSFTQKL